MRHVLNTWVWHTTHHKETDPLHSWLSIWKRWRKAHQVHVTWATGHQVSPQGQGVWPLPHCIPRWLRSKSIPGFTEVPSDEFDSYFKTLGPATLRASPSGMVDLDVFWDDLQERLPMLSSLAKRDKDAISNSADAERSNSLYKLIYNLKALFFLYHNQQVHSGAFERERRWALRMANYWPALGATQL